MSDQRFPTGRFASVGRPLRDEERAALIDRIEVHPAHVREAVDGLDDAQLDTPYRDGGWTVRQVVHHVVDSHLNSYLRFKLGVTADNPTIVTYDQAAWAELPDAKSAPIEGSLAILDALHARWASFLRTLSAEDGKRTIHHPEWGDISLDYLLEIYGWHCPHHEGHLTALRERMGW